MVVFGGLSNPYLLSDLWLLTAADGILTSQLGIVQSLPNHGGNAGTVTVQIIGSGFQNGATVKLIGSGTDILGNNTIVLSATVLTATFDLIGATTGVRDLVVTNPDNSSVSLPSAFTVEQGGSPNVSVDIIGRNAIRFGGKQTYYIVYGNRTPDRTRPFFRILSSDFFMAFLSIHELRTVVWTQDRLVLSA